MVSKIELIYRAKTKSINPNIVRYYMKLQSYLIYIQRQGKIKRIQFDFEDYKVFEEKMKEAIESCQSDTTKEVLVSILNINFTYTGNGVNDIYKQLLECNNKELRDAFKIESLMGPVLACSHSITEDCLSELVIKLHEGRSNKKIIDLCSGKGRFLAMTANSYKNSELFGVEIDVPDVIESKMILDMMSVKYSILSGNLFYISCTQDYDLVFLDFPWHVGTHQNICEDKDGIFIFDNKKINTNWAFAGKAINSMNENGRAYVLMPTGALNSTLDEKIRKQVIDKGLLEMSISLPAGTRFSANVDYSLLVFSKGNENVKMVDATSFCTKGSKKKLEVNDIIQAINNNSSEYVKIIDNSTITENSYKLNSQPYFMGKIIVPHAKQLQTVAKTFRGIQYSSKQYTDLGPGEGKYSVVKISDINDDFLDCSGLSTVDMPEDKVQKYLLKVNDILIVSKGYSLKLAYVKDLCGKQVIPTGNLNVIRVKNSDVLPLYLYIFLVSSKGKALLEQNLAGASIKSLSKKALEEMDIPAIDLDTQEVIKNRYLILQDKIEKLKNDLKDLEEKQSSIFESEVES
mgnify:CR=1 FL=1